jgi:hypothetical protein
MCIRCRGHIFTELLRSNDRVIHPDRWEGFIKYAAEMGSGVTIHIRIIQIGSGIQKLTGGDSHTHRQRGNIISLLPFFMELDCLERARYIQGLRECTVRVHGSPLLYAVIRVYGYLQRYITDIAKMEKLKI